MCHLVLLAPVFGLGLFAVFPLVAAIPSYLLILALSALLYRAVLKAQRCSPSGPEALTGSLATVEWSRESCLIVGMHGEYWTADLVDAGGGFRPRSAMASVPRGSTVRVVGRDGVRLRVAP